MARLRLLPSWLLAVFAVAFWSGCADVVYRCRDVPGDMAPDSSVDAGRDVEPLDCVAISDIRDVNLPDDIPAQALDAVDDDADAGPAEPTYFSPEATAVIDSDQFVTVAGSRFFALGIHAGAGRQYDGVTGPGLCDPGTGVGYVDINISKTHRAADEGANFVYLWGYGDGTRDMLDVTPRFHGLYHSGYGSDIPVEDDVVPIIYNAFGEEDMEGYDEERIAGMSALFQEFITRTGRFSVESMPRLPPVDQVGHMSWHPTFRMSGGGDGKGEVLTDQQATEFARTTNMMIGDAYAWVENRYDMSDPGQAIVGLFSGQIGDIGEGYEEWLAADDPDHRSYFDAGFRLAYSLAERRNSGTVVWMWIQGYAFGNSIAEAACEGKESDSWATGGFPPLWYLQKEVLSTIAAGATGIVFFGYPSASGPEAGIIHTIFRGLSFDEVYGPALLSPRLDMGAQDTMFAGEAGYDGRGRAHLAVKWDAEGRRAFIIGSNPGARQTTIELQFPWSLAGAEILDWELPRFVADDRVVIRDRTVKFTFKADEGVIIRLKPLEKPAVD